MNEKAVAASASSRAGCLIVPLSFDNSSSRSIVRVANPRTAFARVLISLYPKTRPAPGIHPTAIIAPSANVGTDCWIGAYVTIGERSEIGSGCFVGEGCRIGTGVFIAQAGILHPNVTLYDNVRIGSRVIIHAGSVLGSDGFGFTRTGDHYEKFPQVGIVEVGDDVEIGANCCIDRAALGATRIGNGVKLDNLVHIAHNCDIGDHVVIAAQTGFSGSVTVGHHAILGGQVGIGEKARIEAESVVGGKAGILTGQTIRAGEPWWGIPARPLRQHLKGLAGVNRLSEFREQLAELRRKFKEI